MVPQIFAAGEQELGDNQKSITAAICLTFTLSASLRRLRWLCAWICMLINLEEEEILFQFSNSWSECGFCDVSSAVSLQATPRRFQDSEEWQEGSAFRVWLLLTLWSYICGCQSGAPIPLPAGRAPAVSSPSWHPATCQLAFSGKLESERSTFLLGDREKRAAKSPGSHP